MKRYIIEIITVVGLLFLINSFCNFVEANTVDFDGTYMVESAINNKYVLSVENSDLSNNADIQLWENNTQTNQKFKITKDSEGYYILTALNSGKVVNIDNGNNIAETKINQYTYNNVDYQKWQIKDVGNGCYSLISKSSGLYIDSQYGLATNGNKIQLFTGNNTLAQQFKIVKCEDKVFPSGSKTLDNGTYQIQSAINTNYVINVANSSLDNNANIELQMNSVQTSQKFNITYDNSGYYTITAVNSGKLVNIEGGRDTAESNIDQYTSEGIDSQKWIIKDVGNGYYSLISKSSGLCIDSKYGLATDGNNIQLFPSNNTLAQKFKFKKCTDSVTPKGERTIADDTYIIESSLNLNYVLNIANSSNDNNANVELWSENSQLNQKFTVKYDGEGYYTLIAVNSGKALNIDGGRNTAESNINQYDSIGIDTQKWIIKDAGNGYYSLISKSNGLYVDSKYGLATNGNNIQLFTGNNTLAQKFKFVKTNRTTTPTGSKTVENGIYTIKSAVNTSYVVNVANSSLSNGANIELWENNFQASQKFKVTYDNNGYYSIIALNSEKAMNVDSNRNVNQYKNGELDSQKWVIKDVGNGYYSLISKSNGLYMDSQYGLANNGNNIQIFLGNNTLAQKFKFVKCSEIANPTGSKTVEDATYIIESGINTNYVLNIADSSKNNGANLELLKNKLQNSQKFTVKYDGAGYYTLTSVNSGKVISIDGGRDSAESKINQYENINIDSQKWVIKDVGNGYYSLISKSSGLYIDSKYGLATDGNDIQLFPNNGTVAQKFKFVNANDFKIAIDESKYPGYEDLINKLMVEHPNWKFKLLYTGINFADVINGEASVPSRNLVPTSYGGEWINGYTLYDSGWYPASEKAIAYYMDPRNFLDNDNIFQFLDENGYPTEISVSNIQTEVNDTYLELYANDIYTACLNQGVNPYFIISRLIQEQGRNGTTIGTGMNGGDGYTYYNPFDIGASGNGYSEIYNNALAKAKSYGWNTMEKAIEGGITFCKKNWLDNYQSTLYQNKFDIDSTNGTSLYSHQYMQNLMAAYSESKLLKNMYETTGCTDSELTFIVPLYENMSSSKSEIPSSTMESYPMDFKTTGTYLNLRSSPDINSSILYTFKDSGIILISAQRGLGSNWQKVITKEGVIGYISSQYLTAIDVQSNCKYTATVKTNDGKGCNVRVGPSTRLDIITGISDGTSVTVINQGDYNNIDGYNWKRVVLPSGVQGFMPSQYLK